MPPRRRPTGSNKKSVSTSKDSSKSQQENPQNGCTADDGDIPALSREAKFKHTPTTSNPSRTVCILALGLTLGFCLGWFAHKYTVVDHNVVESFGVGCIAPDDTLESGNVPPSGTSESSFPSDNVVVELPTESLSDNVLVEPPTERFSEIHEEGRQQSPSDEDEHDEEIQLEEDALLEDVNDPVIKPESELNNEIENSKTGKNDNKNKNNKHDFNDEDTSSDNKKEKKVFKTFTFKDGKLQEDEEKTTGKKRETKSKTKRRAVKDSKPKDKNGVTSTDASHSATYLQGLDIGYDIRVGGSVVSPKELTNGTGPVRAYIYENFLSPHECEGLMGAHNRHVSETNKNDPLICFDGISTLKKHLKAANSKFKVSTADFTEGTTCMNATFSKKLKKILNWSYSTAFYPGESKFSTVFEQRVLEATGLRPENGGKLQITSYKEGIGYKTHTDCTIGSQDKRDRVATILVYLQDVEEGGETKFPELNISVRPVKGRALVWNNMSPSGECQPLSVHEAAQVKEGHKYILQRWYYYESFFHLGKRPSEPSLPERTVGQPRVSCDEYENGSCRWYDEWNYDHITDYQAAKSNLV
ncbi:uncharacterized protein [Antedon mediterranea]|uniref:uncharacterized protein n=1 Tax=Antedon mediterranea TaxID=105859 RepID=UPI003AF465D4